MWRFPQLDLVMHGYGDTYTDDELERNADIDGTRGGWVELVRDTEVEYAVVPPNSPLAYNLPRGGGLDRPAPQRRPGDAAGRLRAGRTS